MQGSHAWASGGNSLTGMETPRDCCTYNVLSNSGLGPLGGERKSFRTALRCPNPANVHMSYPIIPRNEVQIHGDRKQLCLAPQWRPGIPGIPDGEFWSRHNNCGPDEKNRQDNCGSDQSTTQQQQRSVNWSLGCKYGTLCPYVTSMGGWGECMT